MVIECSINTLVFTFMLLEFANFVILQILNTPMVKKNKIKIVLPKLNNWEIKSQLLAVYQSKISRLYSKVRMRQ
jgi:hypothetical protein